jgi:hypothetical protein
VTCSFLSSNIFWPLNQVGFKKFEGLFTKWTQWDTMVSPLIYFVGIFHYFAQRIFLKEYSVTNSMFFPEKKHSPENQKKFSKVVTIVYSMKVCLRFSTFIFWISPNLSKYIYGWSSLKQHHKIEKKTHTYNWVALLQRLFIQTKT